MKKAVIAGFCRSPFTPAHRGQLVRTRPDDICAQVIKGLLDKTGITGSDVEDLILGCAFPEGEQGFNLARLIVFLSDLPKSVAGMTINRFCGSSMQAIHVAAGSIMMDAGDVFICAGVESMTRIPMTGFNPMPNPDLYESYPQAYISMGETAENIADKYTLTKEQQDDFAIESQTKAAEAQKTGRFSDEIIPIETADLGKIDSDGCIRPGTDRAALNELKPAFRATGSVTAGTASPLTDGAAAVLVCSEDYADRNGIRPLAKISSIAVAGCAPDIMGIGPVAASLKALKRANLSVDDIDVIELNEAFAAQSIACIQDLGLASAKINLDGGAIALGHPLGATGARITGKAAALLKREGKRYALATQCIGGGQGIATVLEAI